LQWHSERRRRGREEIEISRKRVGRKQEMEALHYRLKAS